MAQVNDIPEEWQALLAEHDNLRESAGRVLYGSSYVSQWGERYQDRAVELLSSGDIERIYDADTYQQQLAQMLSEVAEEATLQQQLRYFRQREMVRIIWRDLAGWSDLAETVRDLSAMADACIQQALAKLHGWLTESLGKPYNEEGEEQNLIVLAMGKLGAGELNLSSDIDLIFTFPESGETIGGRKSLSNEEFFTRLGQQLIQALDTVTADGFVFRVDMRLRPFGESGALVSSFDALEDYYQTQGREWERYALIKARAVTGEKAAINELMALLTPFVYRRYLDYGVFDSLREMKAMIAGQLHRKGMENNIKLGVGGIREIEFIGQVFQLIYGGRDKPLQQRPILMILDLLAERQVLSDYAVADLKEAYVFFRRAEHRIQAFADQQTHMLPKEAHEQQRLATLMGFDDWQAFERSLTKHRQDVQNHFEQLLTAPQAEDDTSEKTVSFFTSADDEKLDHIEQLGFAEPQQLLVRIDNLLQSHMYRHCGNIERQRLKKLLPLLVQAAAGVKNPDQCFERLIPLLKSIMRRSAYMSLLIENSLALSQLIKLCAASPMISGQLTRYPVLLDELLDPRALYEVPVREQQQQKLQAFLSTADGTDLERQMYLLREFRQIATLHVAAADVTEVLPLMKVGDQLTELAEILLQQVLKLAWLYLVERHGYPSCTNNDDLSQCGFTIMAYGKLGGLELGYGSDLDLIFLFDDETNQGETNGEKPLNAMVFYTRLAQRIIHLLNTMTAGGVLYEVDTRLRPNGASGLLVIPLSGFADYQQNDAWTWEHQALVRGRCVVGDEILSDKTMLIRQQVLAQERFEVNLKKEVSKMRAKMRAQLDKSTKQLFDLKQGLGGITDIEFLVQYAVLAWSSDLPQLLVYTDNIRILESLAATGKLSEQDANMLAGAYRYYRKLANRCVLQEQAALVAMEDVAVFRKQVTAVWQHWLT